MTIAAVARWMTPFSGPTQRSWPSPDERSPERPRVGLDRLERPADDERRERLDRRDAQLVAATGGEGQPVTLEPVPGVGPEDDVRRRVVGLLLSASDPSRVSDVGNRMSRTRTSVMVTDTGISVAEFAGVDGYLNSAACAESDDRGAGVDVRLH